MKSNDERLRECLKTSMGFEEKAVEDLKTDTSLLELGINSVSFIKAVVAIENEFDLEFQDENLDLARFRTYGDILSVIEDEVGKKS